MPTAYSRSLSTDDLIALSDEIGALARAGVPLEPGLRAMAGDLPGRTGQVAEHLGRRLAEGAEIGEALRAAGFPPAYCAVVVAGLRSGRLAAALEGVVQTARRVAEVRRSTAAALLYPMVLLLVAAVLISFSIHYTTPPLLAVWESFYGEFPWWLQLQLDAGQTLARLLPLAWCALAIGMIAWYALSRRAASAFGGWQSRFVPVTSRMIREGRFAAYCDVLALLIEQRVPLVEALPLAGNASGSKQLAESSRQLAEQVAAGETISRLPAAFPPLLAWQLTQRVELADLPRILRRTADSHRRRAADAARWLDLSLPIWLAAGVGGTLALFYVSLVLGPFYAFLQKFT